ncbi:hypothetical protein [Legionella birminghamensis]|nr:hypothetical protein [Legionella birminghamensis]
MIVHSPGKREADQGWSLRDVSDANAADNDRHDHGREAAFDGGILRTLC